MSRVQIKIRCQGKESLYELRKGLGLQALNAEVLEFDCRKADCGICIMNVVHGSEHLSGKTDAEADFLRAMHAEDTERLACQCRVFGDVTIEIDAL